MKRKQFTGNPKQTTLSHARTWTADNRTGQDGCVCPCCGQAAIEMRRSLHSSMCRVLILLYFERKLTDKLYLHVENFLKRIQDIPSFLRGDFAKLVHWGLIAPKPKAVKDGEGHVGFYAITQKGRGFVEAKGEFASQPDACWIFNDECRGFSTHHVTLRQVLTAAQLSYATIMKNKGHGIYDADQT